MCQTHSHLGDHPSLPTLGGAFAALFQARNPALHAAVWTAGHAEGTQNTGSAWTKKNKGFQSLLATYLSYLLNAICMFTHNVGSETQCTRQSGDKD